MDQFATSIEIKQIDSSQRIISGYAAAWSLDRVGDVIDPGAFQKTLAEKSIDGIDVFIGHDSRRLPVGYPIKIQADARGLYTETKVYETPEGDTLLGVARGLQARGKSLGLSIGYRIPPGGSEMTRVGDKMVRRLKQIDLHEYSFAAAQTIANPDALMTGVKQLTDEEAKAMPYHIVKDGNQWCVYDSADKNRGCSDTHDMAIQHMRALYASEKPKAGMSGDEEKAPMGSFDWTRCEVMDALSEAESCQCSIEAIFPDRVIYRMYGGMAGMDMADMDQLYQRSYSITGDTVTLGDPVPVDVQYTPMPASSQGKQEVSMDQVKAVWDTAYINNLPDSAFLWVQSGGEKDDQGMTVPRSLRHFPYKDSSGKIDMPHLRNALARIPQSNAPGINKAALTARAQRLLENAGGGSSGKTLDLDSPEWTEGVALELSACGDELRKIAEDIAEEQAAWRRLGEDTKQSRRIHPDTRARIDTVIEQLTHQLNWAKTLDQGREDEAVIARYERELALTTL